MLIPVGIWYRATLLYNVKVEMRVCSSHKDADPSGLSSYFSVAVLSFCKDMTKFILVM